MLRSFRHWLIRCLAGRDRIVINDPFTITGCFRCGSPITYDLYCDDHQVIDPKIRRQEEARHGLEPEAD